MASITIVDPNQPVPQPTTPEGTWVKQTGMRDIDFNTRSKYFLSALYPVFDKDNEESVSCMVSDLLLKKVVVGYSYTDEEIPSATLDRILLRSLVNDAFTLAGEDVPSATIESIFMRSLVVESGETETEDQVSAEVVSINLREDVVIEVLDQENFESVSASLTSIQLS